jgi:hypothetical protein
MVRRELMVRGGSMSRGGAPKLNYLDAVKCSMPGVRGDRQRQDRSDGERKRAIGFTPSPLGPLPTVPQLDALSASKTLTVPPFPPCHPPEVGAPPLHEPNDARKRVLAFRQLARLLCLISSDFSFVQ